MHHKKIAVESHSEVQVNAEIAPGYKLSAYLMMR
jgi:hypothetical protein